MQLNIEKHNFCQLEGISNLKNHLEKLKDVQIEETTATGTIEMNVSYLDQDGLECFKSIDFPFDLDLDSLKILEILIGHVEVYSVEGQGLDIHYELIINYLLLDKAEEIKVIEEKDIEIFPESPKEIKVDAPVQIQETKEEALEQIKEDMMEYYEDKLASNLGREDRVITTKTHENVNSFLDFFDSKNTYFKLKCLYVEREEDLEGIAREYKVSLEKLLAGYDRQSHKVIFSIS